MSQPDARHPADPLRGGAGRPHVLVTGASGFVGSHVARALAHGGFRVSATFRAAPGLGADLAGAPGVALIKADLAELADLPAGCEAVVHAAASSAWTGVTHDAVVRDNVVATRRLVELAHRRGCRAFVFLSSMSVYGRIDAAVVDETTPMVDPDVYGASKYLGERLLEERQAALPGLALRLPGVVGRGARRNWLASTAERLRRGEPATLFNPDAAFNNALHVDDLARLIAGALGRGWQGFDALVLGARGHLSVRGVVERLARGMGVVPKLEVRPAAKPSFLISSARATERWGYDPPEIGALVDRFAAEA
jgi:UDP-glucose 4-epimerase